MVVVRIKYYMVSVSESALPILHNTFQLLFLFLFLLLALYFHNNLNKILETLKCKSKNMAICEHHLKDPHS